MKKKTVPELLTEAPLSGMGLNTYSDLLETLQLGQVQGGLTQDGCHEAAKMLRKLAGQLRVAAAGE